MAFSLLTAYPIWLSAFCLIAGLAYAFILYYRNTSNGFSKRLNLILAIIRVITIFLISFLLLSPLLKSSLRHTEKPIVVLALDNSESVPVGKDSTFLKKKFVDDFRKLSQDLQGDYDIFTYSFDANPVTGITGNFTGKETNMGNLFQELQSRYSNRNLAALVLASDGIITKGKDPVYAAENVPYSIYAIALGDTTQHKDLLIARVAHNQMAYLGNDFPLEITLLAHKCSGSQGKLTVSSGENILASQDFSITGEEFSKTFTIILSASKPGVQRFRVQLTSVKGEVSTSNNYKDIFIEVLDGRQKVLLLSSSPHPDIAALKTAIQSNRNYEVEDMLLSDFKGKLSKYNLVILHQIPSVNDAGSDILSDLKSVQVPVMYILGSQSNLQAFNAIQAGLFIPPSTVSFSSAFPVLNNSYSQFSVPSSVSSMLPELSPLSVPFGQYKAGPGTEALFYQKIGSVSTQFPLIVTSQGLDRKTAVIAGEGLWRWRITNFMKAGNFAAFDELISKLVQYLSVKSDKSQFRVLTRNYFKENEPIEFDAEFYNDSYELINQPDVNIQISNSEGKSFPFVFTRTSNAYSLNAGSFPPGDYTFKASLNFSGKAFQRTGNFVVLAVNEELMNTVANHSLLLSLARQHHGEIVYPGEMSKIKSMLKSRDDLKTVAYTQKKYTDLVNIFLVLCLILTLLTAEWFLRKRNGGY